MTPRLATGPVSWGVDFADTPGNPPWDVVLDGARTAGYAGVELGPLGYLPTDPGRLRNELASRDLQLIAGFVFEPLHRPKELPRIVVAAHRVAELVAPAGGTHLIVIDQIDPGRAAAAGRAERAPAPTADERRAVARAIRTLADVAGAAGLTAAVHPHAGTHIEFAAEIEQAAELAPICLDTGHLAYARLDPVEWLRRLGDRVALLHLKDVEPRVLARGLSFWDAVAAGVFCPLGTGCVDLSALARALPPLAWATVEQDRRPGGDPVADLVASRCALETAGLGVPA
ncbi:MAG TPA: sugar phosphate isomerase/epimerase [Solirubrobacter sp.]|nr:sugar phosphate isomerase/epimerase [Solirubrobacter sp.]